MTPEERKQYRAIGGRLAVVLRQREGQLPPPAAMQGLAADLIGDRTELLLPFKDLVCRPAFQRLINKAGTGSGDVERQALMTELGATFAPTVIGAMEELLGGFLDLPVRGAQVVLGNDSQTDRAVPRSTPPATETPAALREQAVRPSGTAPKEPTGVSSGRGIRKNVRWLAIAAVSATVAIGALRVVRSPWVCQPLGLCRSGIRTETTQSLTAASQAARELEEATSLESYRSAAEVLERELLKLRGDTLTSEQKRDVERLTALSQRSRIAVAEEEAAQERLDRAREGLTAAAQLTGAEQQTQLQQARETLQEIPGRSFASGQARELVQELERLAAQLEVEAKKSPEVAPGFPTDPVAAPPPPARSTSTGNSGANQSGAWRDKPLF